MCRCLSVARWNVNWRRIVLVNVSGDTYEVRFCHFRSLKTPRKLSWAGLLRTLGLFQGNICFWKSIQAEPKNACINYGTLLGLLSGRMGLNPVFLAGTRRAERRQPWGVVEGSCSSVLLRHAEQTAVVKKLFSFHLPTTLTSEWAWASFSLVIFSVIVTCKGF